MNSEKKYRKTIEWERLEICSRKLEIQRGYIFHAKMGTIKDRNSKDLTDPGEIKKRWQEYTELYQKGLSDLDNHDSVVNSPRARHPGV